MAAAADLIDDLKIKTTGRYRVECISAKNHCFVILNRADSAAKPIQIADGKEYIPTVDFWGDAWIMVDPWAASLGMQCFYTKADYFGKVMPAGLRTYFT